jgi:membrane protease subunit (stomatin/prohibitin family)
MDAYQEIRMRTATAQGAKGAIDILGADWGRQQAADILGTLAANPGTGGIAAAGAGLGMGMAAGNVFTGMAQQMFAPMQQQTPGQSVPPQPSGRFTQKSAAAGEPPPAGGTEEDPVVRLKKLKEMLDLGLIEQAEFDAKKAEIMSRI